VKSDVAPSIRQLRARIKERRGVAVTEPDSSPKISHTMLAQTLAKRLVDSRWVSKRTDLPFDHDPDELLGRFKWFFTERLQHLIPSPQAFRLPVGRTARELLRH